MKKWIYLMISILLFAGIFWFSSKDADTSSQQSDEVIVKLRLMTEEEMTSNPEKASKYRFGVRKSAHFIMYMVLATFVFLTIKNFTEALGFSFVFGHMVVTLLAGIDEYHQSFVPGRSMELRDVMIDSAGALLAMLLLYILFKAQESSRSYNRVYYYGR